MVVIPNHFHARGRVAARAYMVCLVCWLVSFLDLFGFRRMLGTSHVCNSCCNAASVSLRSPQNGVINSDLVFGLWLLHSIWFLVFLCHVGFISSVRQLEVLKPFGAQGGNASVAQQLQHIM